MPDSSVYSLHAIPFLLMSHRSQSDPRKRVRESTSGFISQTTLGHLTSRPLNKIPSHPGLPQKDRFHELQRIFWKALRKS